MICRMKLISRIAHFNRILFGTLCNVGIKVIFYDLSVRVRSGVGLSDMLASQVWDVVVIVTEVGQQWRHVYG